MNKDVGETQIARQLVDRYPELSGYISFQGLKKLARRALLRGYSEQMVVFGLDTVIKKTISETNTVEMMHLMRNVSYWMPSSEPLCKDRTRQKYCGVRGKKNQAGQINKYNQHRINFNRK